MNTSPPGSQPRWSTSCPPRSRWRCSPCWRRCLRATSSRSWAAGVATEAEATETETVAASELRSRHTARRVLPSISAWWSTACCRCSPCCSTRKSGSSSRLVPGSRRCQSTLPRCGRSQWPTPRTPRRRPSRMCRFPSDRRPRSRPPQRRTAEAREGGFEV